MKRDDPKAPRPNDLAEQLRELLQLRGKVRAAEMAASSRKRQRPEEPIPSGPKHKSKTPSDSSRKLRR
jgi:hypothetical protein